MDDISLFGISLAPWALVVVIVLLSTSAMLVLKRFILARVRRLINKTQFHLDTLFVAAIGFPLTIIILVINLIFLERLFTYFGLASDSLDTFSSSTAKILLIAAGVLFVDRFCVGALGRYAEHSAALRNSSVIIQGVARGLIITVGILVLLGTMGISITPLIASLGITSFWRFLCW